MKKIVSRKALSVALALGLPGTIGAAFIACSGGSTSEVGGGNEAGTGGGDSSTAGEDGSSQVSNKAGSCASPSVEIAFSPMYSAYIPGSTMHEFQIPAVAVDPVGTTTWSASDPSLVQLTPDPTSGGVMITVKGTGMVSIIATQPDGTCGSSVLNVTSALEADWQIGNERYNNGNSLRFGPPDGGGREGGMREGGSFFDASQVSEGGPACTNCHGPTATNGPFKDVSHTPEQTGGFSDQDLIDIIVNGVVPDGGYFDPNVIIADASADPATAAKAYARWQSFHTWTDIGTDQQLGMVVYLRSLTPAPQDGTSNFGGGRDGGRRDGSRDATGQ